MVDEVSYPEDLEMPRSDMRDSTVLSFSYKTV